MISELPVLWIDLVGGGEGDDEQDVVDDKGGRVVGRTLPHDI